MTEDTGSSKAKKIKTDRDSSGDFYHDSKTILSWHAPGRPFKKRSKEYFVNLFLITVAIEIIVFLFHQYILMLVVASLAFMAIALAIVPPHVFYYKLTTEGIRIEDSFFLWHELYDFYITKHHGIDVVKIGIRSYLPGELTIMTGDIAISQIRAVLIQFLPFREYVKPSFTQKMGDWIDKNFPLEKQGVS